MKHHLSYFPVKDSSTFCIHRGTNAPHQCKDKGGLQHGHHISTADLGHVCLLPDERRELGLVEVAQALHHLDLVLLNDHLAAACRYPQRRRHQPVKHPHHHLLVRVLCLVREPAQPALNYRPPSQQAGLHVDHAAAGDGGRGCNCQILHLEDHVHEALHGDDLAAVQAQLFVVVQHCVHVLDPDGVYGTVQNKPLANGRSLPGKVTELHGKHPIGPLLADRVVLAVQLAHGDGLGVDGDVAGLKLAKVVPAHGSQRVCQHPDGTGLHAKGVPYQHEAVAHHHHLVQLDTLLKERWQRLQVAGMAGCQQGSIQVGVVDLRQLQPREQVRQDALEQRHVLIQELWQVDVADGSEHQHGLGLVREAALEVAGRP
mmetsp:Transcript_13252/g.37454  ORF Transcript_13252/g.37454 Transcript_13252/m.37454 type:complete len:371 (-) Transcript_13252:638-1750(-)